MARRPSKDVQRRQKLDGRRKRAAVLAVRQQYPDIIVDVDESVPPDLAAAVRKAVQDVRREYDRCPFDPDVRTFLRDFRAVGGGGAVERAEARGLPGQMSGKLAALAVLEQVFERLPESLVKDYMPAHYPTIDPDPKAIDRFRVHIRSLAAHTTDYGTMYASARRPTVEIAGEHHLVGFQSHALDNLAKRFTFGRKPCSTYGAVFHFVDRCQSFEAVFGDRQYLLPFWEPCPPGVLKRLGITDIRSDPWTSLGPGFYVRTGWFPLARGGGRAAAKTLLRTGMWRTPEERAVRASRLPPAEGRALLDRAAGMTTEQFMNGDGDEVLVRMQVDGGCDLVRRTCRGNGFRSARRRDDLDPAGRPGTAHAAQGGHTSRMSRRVRRIVH